MYRICFVDDDPSTSICFAPSLYPLFPCFLSMLSMHISGDFTVFDPDGNIVASCFDGNFSWS